MTAGQASLPGGGIGSGYPQRRVSPIAAGRPSQILQSGNLRRMKMSKIVEDVQRTRNNSMVPSDIPIYGYIYDCKSGELVEIPEATAAGKAR
jgi:hypothetical protein